MTANIDYASTFDLGPGCSVDTGDHILNGDDHFDADEPTEVSTWDWSPLQAPNYKLANPHVADAIQDFSKQVVPEQIEQYLKTSFLPQGSPLQIIIFTTCGIVSVATSVVAAYLVRRFGKPTWKCCFLGFASCADRHAARIIEKRARKQRHPPHDGTELEEMLTATNVRRPDFCAYDMSAVHQPLHQNQVSPASHAEGQGPYDNLRRFCHNLS